MRRASLTTALLLTASLALVGCGGGDDWGRRTPAAQVAGGAGSASTWPMTGLLRPATREAAQDHPWAISSRQDGQHRGQRPQIGLGSADLVVEGLVEGGLTRWRRSTTSQTCPSGSGRSVRARDDIGIAPPADATIATVGGAGVTSG